ncbi:hypothetical protein Ddc_00340 [Ditylenchus destructor]|nr:hypothetical protein Ddc_00340 [Ditylenchus destructor]
MNSNKSSMLFGMILASLATVIYSYPVDSSTSAPASAGADASAECLPKSMQEPGIRELLPNEVDEELTWPNYVKEQSNWRAHEQYFLAAQRQLRKLPPFHKTQIANLTAKEEWSIRHMLLPAYDSDTCKETLEAVMEAVTNLVFSDDFEKHKIEIQIRISSEDIDKNTYAHTVLIRDPDSADDTPNPALPDYVFQITINTFITSKIHILDLLVHEMLHAWIQRFKNDDEEARRLYKHHGPNWRAYANYFRRYGLHLPDVGRRLVNPDDPVPPVPPHFYKFTEKHEREFKDLERALNRINEID